MQQAELLLEVVPPTLREGREGLAERLETIRTVATHVPVAAVNIPEIREESGRGDNGERLRPFEPRLPPREFAAHIADTCGLESVVNHVIAHEPVDALSQWLEEGFSRFGVRQFALVGGEHRHADYPGPAVAQANALAREQFRHRDVRIGNICIPSRTGEAERVGKKRDAGADFFSTQILYCTESTVALLDALGDAGAVDFYFSFCPVHNYRNIRFLNWLGVDIPEGLEAWLLADENQTLARSKDHILDCWRALCGHLRESRSPIRPHINLSPIGRIPLAHTIDLAQALLR